MYHIYILILMLSQIQLHWLVVYSMWAVENLPRCVVCEIHTSLLWRFQVNVYPYSLERKKAWCFLQKRNYKSFLKLYFFLSNKRNVCNSVNGNEFSNDSISPNFIEISLILCDAFVWCMYATWRQKKKKKWVNMNYLVSTITF